MRKIFVLIVLTALMGMENTISAQTDNCSVVRSRLAVVDIPIQGSPHESSQIHSTYSGDVITRFAVLSQDDSCYVSVLLEESLEEAWIRMDDIYRPVSIMSTATPMVQPTTTPVPSTGQQVQPTAGTCIFRQVSAEADGQVSSGSTVPDFTLAEPGGSERDGRVYWFPEGGQITQFTAGWSWTYSCGGVNQLLAQVLNTGTWTSGWTQVIHGVTGEVLATNPN
ncbi:hypothetical protein KC678_01120 [Candidatus Dojkabacteria bacterium]|uniref:SH3 domain-containing protein n=1 Tax=Candidatus Dojkabacteria bacterium TaxID=2099670 RepID=A0A955ICB8_9BACT|nr:hypothetical protein [Candidatus Dojkabacteria bacterium]